MTEVERDNILQELHRQIQHWEMLAPGDCWLLAISGGCDSMALMHALLMLPKAGLLRLPRLHVAHLNHQLRGPESDADAEFVHRQAQKLGLEVTLGTIDVARAAQETGQSIETAARQQRYRFLSNTARMFGCNKIVLAHNADDNAETILHRIIRGTGIRGLAGIPAVRPFHSSGARHCPSRSPAGSQSRLELIRPLLTLPRREIEEFLHRHHIEYRLDRSNLSNAYVRNRIRHELLPLLREKYNPRANVALLQLGRIAEQFGSILSQEASADLQELTRKRGKDVLSLDAAALAEKPDIQQAEIIRQGLLALEAPQQRIGFKQIRAILDVIHNRGSKPKIIQLPYGLRVECSASYLTISKAVTDCSAQSQPAFTEVTLQVPGTTTLGPGCLWIGPTGQGVSFVQSLRVEIFPGSQDDLERFRVEKTSREEMLDPDRIQGALLLRPRQPGDRFRPLGAGGAKKLGDFFTDAKVPLEMRDRVGLLCDARGVIWVLGMRIAERVKITAATKRIAKLTIVFD